MKLSKRTRYGFRLMVELAKSFEKGPLSIKEIAARQNISDKYLEQIIMHLKTVGPVTAVRGPKGGYMLSLSPSQITLKSLFDIFEGPCGIVECVQNPSECKRADACLSRKLWVTLEEKISETLSSTTLEDLIAGDPADLIPLKSGPCKNAKFINRSRKRVTGGESETLP
jgi:Rrf2 family protein